MARTTSDIVIDAPADEIMDVIADFGAYPSWATGMKTADVVSTSADGRAEQVHFVLDATPIRDEYDLGYVWDGDRTVSWSLVEPGSMLKSMDGAYTLEPVGDASTRVTYQLAVDVSIPLLGMLKRKAEKVIIDTALKGLKKQVEAR
ncbi:MULTISPECIES: SRPBCC family protein [Aeromicrobium]|uniref:SRPBCC family protein n=1 Tax=Aeromicrobium TaxID=2040 RepID=UPI0006FB0DD3|nr:MULTISPECIES: SRPBCC family protein [Aeromicrobium]KQX76157.1 cyclase [Aeromicrobium sp. Root472D3]MBD8608183.1 SRPBCC family protein [Aeromicrobium sp. CFBP 8757]MCL8251872.1 SRPBCC family protein [Aeromicrobium fastidiosum]